MQITAKELASLLNGTVEGDPNVSIHKASKIEEGEQGSITFLANPKYENYAYETEASVILVSNEFVPKRKIKSTLIKVKDVRSSITFLLEQFGQKNNKTGVSKTALIEEETELGASCYIGNFTVISRGTIIGEGSQIFDQVFIGENVKLGNNVVLYPGVRIYNDCIIGDDCIIHSNTVIGSDGFGFKPNEEGVYTKVPQIGNVIIEANVEIGSNCAIDRATMGSTVIRKGVKLDNLIQIAHNVEICENTVIAAQTGVAGSTKIGESCQIGGQVGIVGHIQIAKGTKIQAQSGVARSIKKESTALYGSPALEYSNYLKAYAVFKSLPELSKELSPIIRAFKKENP